MVDALDAVGILAYGPDAAVLRLEGSKAYTKDFLAKYPYPPLPMEIFLKFLRSTPAEMPTPRRGEGKRIGCRQGSAQL